MLFRRDMEPNCAYCEYAGRVNDTEIRCARRGNAPSGRACKAFRYDPFKRVPPRPAPLRLAKFRESDFSL